MARACSVCTHARRTEIDDALAGGGKIEAIAAQFSFSKSTVGRHKLNCLAPRLAAAARIVAPASATLNQTARAVAIASGQAAPTAAETISYSGLVDALSRSLARLERAADTAESDKAIAALAAVSGQLHRAVETAAKLCGLNKQPDAADAPRFSLTIQLGGNATKVIAGAATPAPAVEPDNEADEHNAPPFSEMVARARAPLAVPDWGAAPDADAGRNFSLRIDTSRASPA